MTFLLALISPFSTLWKWFVGMDLATKVSIVLGTAVFVLAYLYSGSQDTCKELKGELQALQVEYSLKAEALDRQSAAIESLKKAQQESQKHYELVVRKAKKEAGKLHAKAQAISKVTASGDDCKDASSLFTADKRVNR